MKAKFNKRAISIFLTLVMLLCAIPVTVFAEGDPQQPEPIILYEENFDGVSGKVSLSAGTNTAEHTAGWIYAKNSNDGSAYIENNKLYFSGSKYDVIYRDGGQCWGNYTLEADFCYTDETASWGGMLYNVQSPTKFQKAGIALSGNASANGFDGSDWTNNDSSHNKINLGNAGYTVPGKNEPFRMKVVVENKTASFYYAMLDSTGAMTTDYILVKSISNIPADAQTGSIGFMTCNGSLASYWVDNIKCYSYSTVSYFEDFDSYENTELTADAENKDVGIYYDRNLSSGTAAIRDGKLHLEGGGAKFDAIFFTMGKNWTDYALEADITYTTSGTGWGGLLYRSTDIDNFQKAAVNTSGRANLNGQASGEWYKDTEGVSKIDYTGNVELNVASRLRVETVGNSAKLYIAYYDTNTGDLGEWNFVMEISDNFDDVHMSGTIGMIVGGSSNSKTKGICIDNVTVSRVKSVPQTPITAADIYEPESGIVNPPVVVQKLTTALPSATGERAAVVLAEINADMKVLDSKGKALADVSDFIDTYRSVLIPAFVIDSEAEATALAELIHEKKLIDCYVVADSKNASLVRKVRLANSTTACISGALIFDDLNTAEARKSARTLIADSMCYVAISKAPISEEATRYFNVRQIGAWCFADDKAAVYSGISNGYHGIVSTDVSAVYDIYESITKTTVSGKPIIVAHRGANNQKGVGYPENTLLGYKAAIEEFGADAIEVDARLTSDGYIYLMHDDTVDRTTNGTGNGANLTLAQLKALSVDEISSKKTTVPTLEELFEVIKGTDTVVYCHINVKDDTTVAAVSHLVEKYNCQDNVIFFISYDSRTEFNPNTDRTLSGGAYNLDSQSVVADGILFTAGNKTILEGKASDIDGIIAMRSGLNPYNYQPLFYKYSNQGAIWGTESSITRCPRVAL